MQTKKRSLTESIINTITGLLINYSIMYYIVYPIMHINVSHCENTGITIILTVVSVFRNYIIRRLFNDKRFKSDTK